MTPLHIACKYGSQQVFSLLFTRTEPEILACNLDDKLCLPLHYACYCKVEQCAMVKMMLQKLKYYDENNATKYLQKALEQQNNQNKTVLHISIENNHVNIVKMLMKYNVNVNQSGSMNNNYPIHMAAKVGSVEIMEILKAEANIVNNKNENLLHIAACANQDKFILKYLQNERKKSELIPAVHSTNMRQQTPLLVATLYGNIESVDVLLKYGKANLEDRDLDQNTIFHLCALHNKVDIFNYLLQQEESKTFLHTNKNFLQILKQSNKYDNTVVHIACKDGHIDILRRLFSSKLLDKSSMDEFVFAKNNFEQTGFHIACYEGHYEIVKFFLTTKSINTSALVQDVDETFNTSLHLAAIKGNHRIIR